MNKKNISLILAGILLLALKFNIHIGPATIDLFSDVLAFILIWIGIRPLAVRNIMFKKARNIGVIGLVFVTFGQFLNLFDWHEAAANANTLIIALSTIFTIYFSYYFTEALMLEAKFQEKSACTRSFRMIWLIFGVFTFADYIAFMSNVSVAAIVGQSVTAICAIYYISSVRTACNQLYMDGLPTKHMNV